MNTRLPRGLASLLLCLGSLARAADPEAAPPASDPLPSAADLVESAIQGVKDAKDRVVRAAQVEAINRGGLGVALNQASPDKVVKGMDRAGNRIDNEVRAHQAHMRNQQIENDLRRLSEAAAEPGVSSEDRRQLLDVRALLANSRLTLAEYKDLVRQPAPGAGAGAQVGVNPQVGRAGASTSGRSGALDPAGAGSNPGIPTRGQAADTLSADGVEGLPDPLIVPGRSADLIRASGGGAASDPSRPAAPTQAPAAGSTAARYPPNENLYSPLHHPDFLLRDTEGLASERNRLRLISEDPVIDPETRRAAATLLALSDREPGRLPSTILAEVNAAAARPQRGAAADSVTADGVDSSLEDPLRATSAAGDAIGDDAGVDPSRVRTPSADLDRMRAARAGLNGQTVSDDGADAIRRALAGAGPAAPADPAPPGSTQRWTIAELQSHTARMQSGAHMAVGRVTAIDSRLAATRDRAEIAALEAERADLVSRIAWYNDQIAQNSDNLVARGAPAAAPVAVPGVVTPTTPGTGTGLFVNPNDPPRWDPAGLRSHNQRSYNMALLHAQAIAALDARIAGEGRNNTPLRNQLLAERAERIAQLNGHNHDIDANNRLLAQRGLPGDEGVPAPGAAPAPAPPAAAPASGRSVSRLQTDNWRAEQNGRAELATIQDLDARIATEGRNNSTVRRQLQAERDQAVNRLRALNALIQDNNRDLAGQGAPANPLLPMPGTVRAPAGDDWRDGPADGDAPGITFSGISNLITRINLPDHLNPDKLTATGDDGGAAVSPGSVGDDLVANTASNRVMHGRTAGAHVGDANSSTTTGDPNPLGDLQHAVGSIAGAITNFNGAVTGVRDIRRQIQDMRHSGSRNDAGGSAAGGDGVPPAGGDPGTAAADGSGVAGTGAADHGHGPGGDIAVGRAGARTGGTANPGNIARAGSSTGGTVAGRTIGGKNPPGETPTSSGDTSGTDSPGGASSPRTPVAGPPVVNTPSPATQAATGDQWARSAYLIIFDRGYLYCYTPLVARSGGYPDKIASSEILGGFPSKSAARSWLEKNAPVEQLTGMRVFRNGYVYAVGFSGN